MEYFYLTFVTESVTSAVVHITNDDMYGGFMIFIIFQ